MENAKKIIPIKKSMIFLNNYISLNQFWGPNSS